MNTEREAKNPHSHLVIGKQIESLKADNAALVARNEALEDRVKQLEEDYGYLIEYAAKKITESGISGHEQFSKLVLSLLPMQALKAGDVQAPKEGWYEDYKADYKAKIAAAPTDTEGK